MENRKTSSRKKEPADSLLKNRIPFLQGRPDRALPINHDDMVNLAILLNTCKTVAEFLAKV
jgi:hypothetical protein